jgi:hypothetical protein
MSTQAYFEMYGVKVMSLFKNSLLFGAVLALGACAPDVQDIDRTQPDKVEKSLLVGEWYFVPTVVEADVNQGLVFDGLRGELERIRWEIREHELVAYRSYALLIGAEDGNGDTEFNGSPVAIFPISSHFDVRREYNPATGEQNNILVENTTDRPWYERDYIRVDWAKNLIPNPYRMESLVDAYSWGPLDAGSYYERDHEPNNPHRSEVTAKNINVVGQYFLYADYWTCMLSYNFTACDGDSTAKIKLSFMKIEGTRTTNDAQANILRDYEPLYYPDFVPIRYADGTPVTTCYEDGTCARDTISVFERFGYFRSERLAYDDEYGWTRDGRLFVGHRWNIWDRTYDGEDLIAPEDRDTGKVVYYTNVQFPEAGETDWNKYHADGLPITSAWDATQRIATEWDLAFRQTVAALRGPSVDPESIDHIFEVRRNSCNSDNVEKYAGDHGLDSVLSDNGISNLNKDNLERACALLEYHSDGDFTWQKLGDIRYSFFNWVARPQQAGPLGYGPSSADPVTGEIISAAANVYGTALETYASYAADVVALMNDDLDIGDVINGTNVRDHIRTSQARWNRSMNSEALEQLNDAMFKERTDFFGGRVPKANSAFFDQKFKRGRKLSADELNDARLSPVEGSKLDRIIGTPIEKELLINDDLRRGLLGPQQYQPGQVLTGDLAGFSPISYMLGEDAQLRREHSALLGAHAIDVFDLEAFDDAGMVHLADQLDGNTWAEVYDFMLNQMYRSVMAHEVGHTLGLRHNFQGSFDALNYDPKFWENYNPTTGKVEKVSGGVPTNAERLMYSSIMDYDARFYADSLEGIGPYDRAAIKFGYGTIIETFRGTKPAVQYYSMLDLHDYHSYPKMFSGQLACNSTFSCHADWTTAMDHYSDYLDLDYEAAVALSEGDMTTWGTKRQESFQEYEQFNNYFNSYLLDGLSTVTTVANCTAANDYCGMWDRKHIRLSELQEEWTKYYEYFQCTTAECQDENSFTLPDEVPYKFCPDEIAMYGSWVECLPYDKGATYHEVTTDRMVRYDAYYVFRNFKRDRAEMDFNDYLIGNYLYTLYDRFFAQQTNVYRNYLYSFSSLGRDKFGNEVTLADFPLGKDWQSAGIDGMNFLNSVIEQPEPGEYCLDAPADTYRPLAAGDSCLSGQTMEVGLGVGKHYNTKWSSEYMYKATVLGTFWDKYAAMFALTDNEGFFYRDYSSLFDVGAFQLSYWSGPFKDKMLQLFRGAFNGGTGDFAWRYKTPVVGDPEFVAAPVVDVYSATQAESDEIYDSPKIQSASSYTLQWYGVVLPMARFNSGFDYSADFVNYARICLDGYIDCQTFDTAVAEYVDPLTGYRYIASRTDKPDAAIAPALLDDAQAFIDVTYAPVRGAFDTAKADYDAAVIAEDPNLEDYRQEMELRRAELQAVEHKVAERTAFLDTVRDFGTYFGGAWR